MAKKGGLVIYWDYELQNGADVSIPNPKKWGMQDYIQTDFILKELKKRDIKTCFAALAVTTEKGDLPYHASDQVAQMDEEGHEVASHSYDHRRLSLVEYSVLVNDLKKSKNVIEKTVKNECISFVPPWNKPQRFLGMDFDVNSRLTSFRFTKLKHKDICKGLNEAGFKTYRNCFYSLFGKDNLSRLGVNSGIVCIPLYINAGFGFLARKLVDKAIKSKGLAVLYEHPWNLSNMGKGNQRDFINFLDYIKKQRDRNNLDILLPRDFIENA